MKRTVLGVSLVLAGVTGGFCLQQILAAHPATSPVIAGSPQWQQIVRAWEAGTAIDRSPEFSYPFTEDERNRLFKDIEQARRGADELLAAKLIEPAEADLLKQELEALQRRIGRFRTKGLEQATCYEPVALLLPAAQGAQRLEERLGLLTKIAESRTLHPAVLAIALATAREDLQLCANQHELRKLSPKEQQRARTAGDAAKVQLDRIKARMNARSLEDTPEWTVIAEAWAFMTPFAQSGQSTMAQRKAVDGRAESAKQAANALADQGRLSAAESELLQAELARLCEQVYRDPPTDEQVTCYVRMFISPAQESLTRLNAKSAFLARAAEQEQVSRAVLERVLPAIEKDMQILADPAEMNRLQGPERAKARKLAEAVRRNVDAMRAKLR